MDRVRGVEKVFSIECNSVFRTRISLKITVVFSTSEYILRYCININCTRGCWIVNIYIKKGEKINFSNENWRKRKYKKRYRWWSCYYSLCLRFTPSNIISWFNFLVRLGNLRVYTFVLDANPLKCIRIFETIRIIVSTSFIDSNLPISKIRILLTLSSNYPRQWELKYFLVNHSILVQLLPQSK